MVNTFATMIAYDEHIKNLPDHLKEYIVDQEYEHYTPIDQAVWRYVMRKNLIHMTPLAHKAYESGLKKTGIRIDEIPTMYGMNRILKEIGWGAVAVDGFIPPNIFMEFQAHKVLVIAMDIRTLKHIEYTPAPDIIHESAGHAPIIADNEYAQYLIKFGEIGSKAFSSATGFEQYEAIRYLSIIKEDTNTLPELIEAAETKLLQINMTMQQNDLSEMALIRRLHWWTVEYGLIGSLEEPKIYGAGLLSSIGEGIHCLKPNVKKIPYSIEAKNYEFDITKPQPQLFVTPSFAYLTEVLEDFSNGMAYKTGGLSAIQKAINSDNLSTIVYNSGLQVSGIFSKVLVDENNKPIYIQTNSPTSLNYLNKQLEGHGVGHHKDGFGSPIGRLKKHNISLEEMDITYLTSVGFQIEKRVVLEFESNIIVSGIIKSFRFNNRNELLLISFEDCNVAYEKNILFKPEWGIYDMAVGARIVSAFPDAVDKASHILKTTLSKEKTIKYKYTKKELRLQKLYHIVREIREKEEHVDRLFEISSELIFNYKNDWLLLLEILEFITHQNIFNDLKKEITIFLKEKGRVNATVKSLIEDGIQLIEKGEITLI